jgi:ketol-acid reductoisomerase
MAFSSTVFQKEKIVLGGTEEWIVRGGRHLFALLPKACGIPQIGVIGWSSRGGGRHLRNRSPAAASASGRAACRLGPSRMSKGASPRPAGRGEMYVIAGSDLILLLISDAAGRQFRADHGGDPTGCNPRAVHGFLVATVSSGKASATTSTSSGCARGMGPSVRGSEQGRDINGAGINCSFAVHQDIDGKATDYALAGDRLGSPAFETTLEFEYKSDIFGERGILLARFTGLRASTAGSVRWARARRRLLDSAKASLVPSASRSRRPACSATKRSTRMAGGAEAGLLCLLRPRGRHSVKILRRWRAATRSRSVVSAAHPPHSFSDERNRGHRDVAGAVAAQQSPIGNRPGDRRHLCRDDDGAADLLPAKASLSEIVKDRSSKRSIRSIPTWISKTSPTWSTIARPRRGWERKWAPRFDYA